MSETGEAMNAAQGLILANLLMIIFNLGGMALGFRPPRPVVFASIWIGVTAVVETIAFAVWPPQ